MVLPIRHVGSTKQVENRVQPKYIMLAVIILLTSIKWFLIVYDSIWPKIANLNSLFTQQVSKPIPTDIRSCYK